MRVLGVFLLLSAVAALIVGFSNARESRYEELLGEAARAAENLYRFARAGEQLGFASSGASDALASVGENTEKLTQERADRELRSKAGFVAAGALFLGGAVCLIPRRQR